MKEESSHNFMYYQDLQQIFQIKEDSIHNVMYFYHDLQQISKTGKRHFFSLKKIQIQINLYLVWANVSTQSFFYM